MLTGKLMNEAPNMVMNRRHLLGLLGASCAMTSVAMRAHAAPEASTKRLGLQMITVMRPLKSDFKGTLRAIANQGYSNVETLGSFGCSADEVAAAFAEAGLVSNAQHVCPATFYPVMDAWAAGALPMSVVFAEVSRTYSLDRMPHLLDEAIRSAQVLGQKFIVWSNLMNTDLASSDGISGIIRAFNRAGDLCAKEGLVFAFHNGSKGFAPIDGKTPYDRFLEETDPDTVKMEMDVYWATKSGVDPTAYLRRYPGRYTLCHLKDMDAQGNITAPGSGQIDFQQILDAGGTAGIQSYFFEYDQAPNPLADIAAARAFFQTLKL
jgi:sugar phosphate isomerase/epimerase